MSDNEELKKFLMEISTKLDSDGMSSGEFLLLSEYFIRHKMLTESNRDLKHDWKKCLFLGMYMYEFIIPKLNNTSNTNDTEVEQ